MNLTDAGKNLMLNELATVALFAAVHDELGAQIGARQSVTWNTASTGVLTASNQPSFSIPGATIVDSVSLWDASVSGNQLGSDTVTQEVFTGPGTYSLSSITVTLSNP